MINNACKIVYECDYKELCTYSTDLNSELCAYAKPTWTGCYECTNPKAKLQAKKEEK